jgi:hypothetical protein
MGMTSCGFGFPMSVLIGHTHVVLASEDFLHWTPIATYVATSASVASRNYGY